ncbi:hypothetical protein CDAR_289571 [Caerostris darwini]|uniref:Uncharacterized protein n=1 Tax=Caerostris darwini TaxID=1538125 RepID=A0AAV4P4P8_9ARAC|nr:hypothetical protein CDAR_289571 [Caerostris darwini]
MILHFGGKDFGLVMALTCRNPPLKLFGKDWWNYFARTGEHKGISLRILALICATGSVVITGLWQEFVVFRLLMSEGAIYCSVFQISDCRMNMKV